MWARVHKIDRARRLADGSTLILLDDERKAAAMARVPGLSTTIAVARVLNARRLLEVKYGGRGEVRYAANATLPGFLFQAIIRAGASVSDLAGETVHSPPQPSGLAGIVDTAFAELAQETRVNAGCSDIIGAAKKLEADRRRAPLDRESDTTRYWTSVFELAALAGELWRPRGRWVETQDTPVPFAIRLVETGLLAKPARLAQRIVEGEQVEESLATASLE